MTVQQSVADFHQQHHDRLVIRKDFPEESFTSWSTSATQLALVLLERLRTLGGQHAFSPVSSCMHMFMWCLCDA